MICPFDSQVNLSVMDDDDAWLERALSDSAEFPPALCGSYLRLPSRQKQLSASFANGFPFAGYL